MLPSGGILVFVTGQQEVYTLCKKLKNTFPDNRGQKGMVYMKNMKIQSIEYVKISIGFYSKNAVSLNLLCKYLFLLI